MRSVVAADGRVPGLVWHTMKSGQVAVQCTVEIGGRPGEYVDKAGPFKRVDPGKTTWRFFKNDADGSWWVLPRHDALSDAGLYALAPHVTPEALAVLKGLSAGASTKTEGTFTILPSGYVKLMLDRRWQPKPPVAGIIALRHEAVPSGDGAKGAPGVRWYHLFRASRGANLVAPELARSGFPNIAAKLKEATEAVAEPFDEARTHCDPLNEMASAGEPSEVHHPLGKAVLHDVAEAMRVRAPAKMALFPYQTVGVAFCALTGFRCIIGDAPGAGKTSQALAAIILTPATMLPAVVVVPASVYSNWHDECKMWLPSVPVWSMPKRDSDGPPANFKGIVITRYSVVAYQTDELARCSPQYLIVDEAHRIKNSDAQQTVAVTHLAEGVPHVALLTGTPVANNVGEIWNLLATVDMEDYGRKGEFIDNYALTEEVTIGKGRTVTKIIGVKPGGALKDRLRCVMIRRLKEDVMKWLPDKTRHVLTVEPDAAAMREYAKAEKEFAQWLNVRLTEKIAEAQADEEGDVNPDDVEREVRRRLARSLENEAMVKVGQLRGLVGRMKVGPALDTIVDFVEAEEPLIVFAVHKEVVAGLAAGLDKMKVRYAIIDGSTPTDARGPIVRAFQDGKLDVIIGSEAMSEGVTLTRASNVLFVERFWTSVKEEQAEDRAHRQGQKNAVAITFLEVPDTIDQRLRGIIDVKRKLVAAIVSNTAVAESDTSTLADLFASFATIGVGAPAKRSWSKVAKRTNRGGLPTVNRSGVLALIFERDWTKGQATQWAGVNGFPTKRLEAVGGAWVLRMRAGRGTKTRTVRLSDGVSAVVVES